MTPEHTLEVAPQPFEHGDGRILLGSDGAQQLHYERLLKHPPERVWRAITDSGEISRWARASWDFEPRVGGAMELILNNSRDPADWVRDPGVVSAYEPPRLLEFTIDYYTADGIDAGPHVLRWTLAPAGDGCLLTFSDRFAPHKRAPNSIACGWHYMLDQLEQDLGGAGADWQTRDDEMTRIYWRYRNATRPDGWPA
ncbi:MAG: SRPBCC domain-containing protein [Pseudomonadota bacterium]